MENKKSSLGSQETKPDSQIKNPVMKKRKTIKEDGRILIYYSFDENPVSSGEQSVATRNSDNGGKANVWNALEPNTRRMGCHRDP